MKLSLFELDLGLKGDLTISDAMEEMTTMPVPRDNTADVGKEIVPDAAQPWAVGDGCVATLRAACELDCRLGHLPEGRRNWQHGDRLLQPEHEDNLGRFEGVCG